jgi:hypothetical protein
MGNYQLKIANALWNVPAEIIGEMVQEKIAATV